ncbi:hypothetical protein CR513_58288, partial [Mucuna pruriens]
MHKKDLCITNSELRRLILEEIHKSKLSLHLGMTKIYQDLKKMFLWLGIKREVFEYKANIEHRRLRGLLQMMEIPEWILPKLYIKEIVCLHGVPSSIIFDRDPWFTSRFWQSLHQAFGTKLRLNSATIQSLKDLWRVCMLDHLGMLDKVLPLIEFTYNNNYHASIGMVPFQALYRRCKTPLSWYQDGEHLVVGPNLVQQMTKKIKKIQDNMKTSQSRQ